MQQLTLRPRKVRWMSLAMRSCSREKRASPCTAHRYRIKRWMIMAHAEFFVSVTFHTIIPRLKTFLVWPSTARRRASFCCSSSSCAAQTTPP